MDNQGNHLSNSDDEYFNLKYVYDCFTSSLLDEDDVHLGQYLDAYRELSKFCSLMGTVFGFVGSEIDSKSSVLNELRKEDVNGNFGSLKAMVKYEMESQLLSNIKYTSGSRTLLRLHRGLDFIKSFLKEVGDLNPDDGTSTVGQRVYGETLSKYHAWYIRRGAHLAMYVLPTKKNLLKRVCGDRTEQALAILPQMLEVANEVYERTELCFRNNDLLDLP